MCDLNDLICPVCQTKLKVKGLQAEVVEISDVIVRKRKVKTTGNKPTPEQKQKIAQAYKKDPINFDSELVAKKLGLRTQQVAAVKAWFHPSLGSKAYFKKCLRGEG